MLIFTSPDPLYVVTSRLQQAGRDGWTLLELSGSRLSIRRITFWKGGALWSFQGRLEAFGPATRLRGELRLAMSNLYLPYVMIGLLLAMLEFQGPGHGVFLRGLPTMCLMLTPATGLRWLMGLGERQALLQILEQAGLREGSRAPLRNLG